MADTDVSQAALGLDGEWHRRRVLWGCVSFAGFFAHFKEKIVGNDFSRQPRMGEAQGCAEQIGSGASPK
jgi:hypothetical protein